MIELRDYQKGDEPEVMNLLKTVLAGYGLKTNPALTDSDILNIEQSYLRNNGAFKVLTDDKKIIGSFGIFKISTNICELRKMYLYKSYHGQGLGRRMMIDAINVAKCLGYMEMVLETNSRLEEAKRLYEKFGFKEYQPDHLSDRCDYAMKLKL
jgi:putative acetyltransferase